MGASAGGNPLLKASISPLQAGMRNKFVTRRNDGDRGRKLISDHGVAYLSKLLCLLQKKDREATVSKQVYAPQNCEDPVATTLFHGIRRKPSSKEIT